MPVVTSNCSNNYGPYHFPEKLIPLAILNALGGKPIPVSGDGGNIAIGFMSRIMRERSCKSLSPGNWAKIENHQLSWWYDGEPLKAV